VILDSAIFERLSLFLILLDIKKINEIMVTLFLEVELKHKKTCEDDLGQLLLNYLILATLEYTFSI
jgi:hypothetical protein